MKIILDDTYTLKGDTYCCWVTECGVTDDCKAQGIETETPEEIERLKEMWK